MSLLLFLPTYINKHLIAFNFLVSLSTSSGEMNLVHSPPIAEYQRSATPPPIAERQENATPQCKNSFNKRRGNY